MSSSSQTLRRILQGGVVFFVIYTAWSSSWRNYKHAHNHRRIVALIEGETFGMLYGLNEDMLSLFGESEHMSSQFLGFPWGARVAGMDTMDPFAVIATGISQGSISLKLLLGLSVPVLLALLFGKVFCSHLCPMRLFFEIGQAARKGLEKLGFATFHVRPSARFGGWVALGGLIATFLWGTTIWLYLLPYVSFSAALFLLITTGLAISLLAVVSAWMLIDMIFAPGVWCHNFCPTGWLLEQLGRMSILRLMKRGKQACPTNCAQCTKACPYELSPRNETHRPACDNCGRCVQACPSRKLVRRLAILPGLLLSLLLSSQAFAHHNKGLPHYGYYENYPQVPTEEYIAIQGRWEIGAVFFNFQGYDRRAADTPNDVKIFLYLYDLERDVHYQGPLTVEIRQGNVVVSRFDRLLVDEESVYSTRETLPQSGDYDLVALVQGHEVILPFHVELTDNPINWLLIGGLGGPVALLFVLALVGRRRRRKQKRRRNLAPALGAMLAMLSYPTFLSAQELSPELIEELAACQCGKDIFDCLELSQKTMAAYPHYETETGTIMVMGGIPWWLFISGIIGVILCSFFISERLIPKTRRFRLNLIEKRSVYRLVKSRWFQVIPQWIMIGFLIFLIYAGLFGSRVANITPIVVWTLWWSGLVFAVLFFASIWCFVCPWDGLANLISRLRLKARVIPLSLDLPFPSWLRNVYPAIALFIVLTWLELGYGVTTDPRATAYMGIGMAAMTMTCVLLWSGKKFCAHFCPVGRICGIYSTFSPVEIRAKKPKACRTCTTEDCKNGNERGYPCPTGLSLKVLQSSANCTMCTECIKSCKRNNVAIRVRPFASDLHNLNSPKIDEAWLALVLLSLTLFHGLTMTPLWENFAPGQFSLLKWMDASWGMPHQLNFTLAMFIAVMIPIFLYWLSCQLAARWIRPMEPGVHAKQIFRWYAYSLLPVALFYHLAHNLMHLMMEGAEIVPLISDPLGHGTDFLGTRTHHLESLLSEQTLGYLQVGLILIGHIIGTMIAHRFARKLFPHRQAARRSLIPMTAMMVVLSALGLSLMHLDMNMRMGRM